MNWKIAVLCCASALGGCATYHDIKEIKYVGFSDNPSKGKSAGQIAADDCVFQVFGYYLGGQPDISTAISNARTGKKTKVTDVAYASNDTGREMRYVNDLTTKYGGFNAVVFGKTCIEVKGAGYL